MPLTSVGAGALLTVIGLVLVGRALTVYPLCLLFRYSSGLFQRVSSTFSGGAGSRGARAGTRACSSTRLPALQRNPDHSLGVVVFSVVVQGLTMPLLLWKLGLLPKKLVAAAMSAH